jgi:hypothetical protein
MKKFFREWGRRCAARFSLIAFVAPFVFLFVMIRDGLGRTDITDWVVLAVLTVIALICGKTAWRLNFSWDAPVDPPPTPAQLRQQRLLTVADSVAELPAGITFADLCETLDEKQTRKLLHHLHQIRPGERHLRDVLPKVR